MQKYDQANTSAVEEGSEKGASDSAISDNQQLREILHRFVMANGKDAIPSQIDYLES